MLGHRSFVTFLLDGFRGIPRSLVRFIVFQLSVMFSTVLAYLLWTWFEKPSGLLGLGVPMVISCLTVFLALWVFQLGRILLFYPFPTCRKGKCYSIDDYSWHVPTIYVRYGVKFMEVLPDAPRLNGAHWKKPILADDATLPYKKLTGFRQWSDDLDLSAMSAAPSTRMPISISPTKGVASGTPDAVHCVDFQKHVREQRLFQRLTQRVQFATNEVLSLA